MSSLTTKNTNEMPIKNTTMKTNVNKNSMNAQTLSALSVVCNHTTMPLVDKQAEEIKKLKIDLAKYKERSDRMTKFCDNWLEVREWLEGGEFVYMVEEFDRQRMEEGEEPIFNSREYYDDNEL